jgi:hypothetical protein
VSTPPTGPGQATPTQIVGQQSAPSTPVPAPPPGGMVPTTAGVPSNSLAVVSLVTAVGSFLGHIIPFVGGFILAVVAVITGHMALSQIKKTGEPGKGLATAGLVIGYIHIAIITLLFVFLFSVIVAIFAAIFTAAARG